METAVFKDLGIKGRVLLLTLLPTSLLALVLGGYFTWMQLAELRSQYDAGAHPIAVLQDMLELTHWLTRLKIAPEAAKMRGISARSSSRSL